MAKQFKKAPNKIQRVVKKPRPTVATAGGKTTSVRLPSGEFVAAIGRRKESTARVRLYFTAGDYVVNDKPMAQYFSSLISPQERFVLPFKVTNTLGKYAVSVKVDGSGLASQLDAIVLGIARALVKVDPELKKALRDAGLITRDPRMKESRKPNTGGKARRQRQSPKR